MFNMLLCVPCDSLTCPENLCKYASVGVFFRMPACRGAQGQQPPSEHPYKLNFCHTLLGLLVNSLLGDRACTKNI